MAEKIEREIRLGNVGKAQPVAEVTTDGEGKAYFSSLKQGLYLVMSTSAEQDGYIYSTASMMLLLPARNASGDGWDYEVIAYAKPEKKEVRMDYDVVKVWRDNGFSQYRPQTISIQLFCDGVAYGNPITLPDNGKWTYTWHDLDVNHYWTVKEERVNGYLDPDIQCEGNTFIVTNIFDEPDSPPEEPKLPQTGQLWWPVPMLLAVGLLFIVLGLIRRREGTYEK